MTSPPKPPTGLLKCSRERWRTFWLANAAAAVDPTSDMARLVRWIHAADEYERAVRVIRKSRLVRGSMGQPVLNPLVSYCSQLEAMITRTEKEFGMTPLARARLDLKRPSTDDELERFFAELGSA